MASVRRWVTLAGPTTRISAPAARCMRDCLKTVPALRPTAVGSPPADRVWPVRLFQADGTPARRGSCHMPNADRDGKRIQCRGLSAAILSDEQMEGPLQFRGRHLHHAASQNLRTSTFGEIKHTLLEALEVPDDESVDSHGGRLGGGFGNGKLAGDGGGEDGGATSLEQADGALDRALRSGRIQPNGFARHLETATRHRQGNPHPVFPYHRAGPRHPGHHDRPRHRHEPGARTTRPPDRPPTARRSS